MTADTKLTGHFTQHGLSAKADDELGARYWVSSPNSGPEAWGARAAITFLFPK